ncbi:lipid A export permease/ATP-binding protein MsbA [Maribrevibacterium harenarium]|uniref:lipid A export permease/ATP-binding protein MsbA n=1 Tax=Maribrevibacterium harenarium TaxID=2589817 RepID=UPI002E26E97A
MANKTASTRSAVADYKRLLSYLKAVKLYFALGIFGFIIFAAMEPAMAALLKHIVDVVASGQAAEDRHMIPLMIMGIFLFRGVGTFFGSYFMAKVSTSVVQRLRNDMFAKLLVLPAEFYYHNASGRLMSKLTYDTEQVIGAITNALRVIVREGLTVVGLVGFLLYTNWRLSLLFFVILPFVGLVVAYTTKRFRKLSSRIQNAMGGVTDVASEAIRGHEVVKIYGGQAYEQDRFEKMTAYNAVSTMKMEVTRVISIPLIQMFIAAALSLLVWLALDPAISAAMGAGDFVAFIGAAGMLSKPVRMLTEVNSVLQKGVAAAHSIFTLLDTPNEVEKTEKINVTVSGGIEFERVSFTYPGADKPALQDVSLAIKPGQMLALVGESGGGKSSLVSLLPRFYDIQAGRILIDGKPHTDFSLSELRQHIAIVNQNIVLFNGSVRDNIAYGELAAASDEQVIAAAKMANAWGFIEALPDGLNTQVGENGVLLSGGQRQRLSIARAILKDSPILILDEATSALDTESEKQIQEAIDTLLSNKTTIAIAHRLSTIENADVIAVVHQGRIVEVGSHGELLAKNGFYANLYQQQHSLSE